ncbi:MAG: GAF domain-containing protein [Hyphomicrobiaceae bacterium]|nr:GAF domain-containing protein [Hyphomicrobiaceae bacterium]
MAGSRLTAEDIASVLAFAAEAPRPLAILDAIGRLATARLDARGFTMFRYVHATAEVERLHSSDPVAYPVGGRKRIADYPNNQAVLARGEVYIAKGRDDIRGTYKDFEKIFGLGVTSIMNVPVRLCGRNVGAINLFGEAGQFDDARVADARVLAGLMLPALLGWGE